MSLITKCPACNTMFRVVPDQLRISGGWVRCGNCDEVFDGNAQLQPTEPPPNLLRVPSASDSVPAAVAPQPPETPAARVAAANANADSKAHADAEAEAVPEDPPQAVPSPVAAGSREPIADPIAEAPTDLLLPPTDAFLERSPREHIDLPLEPIARELDVSPLGDAAPPPAPRYVQAAPPEHVAAGASLSFMREPKRQRSRASRSGAAWAVTLCGVLLVALGGQVLVHERDAIAATQPAAAPLLETLCDAVGCQVHAYRNIDALLIDNSGFAKVRADTYRFTVTLRNTAAVPIAVPALELTLSDALSQPVIRRVLQASDWGSSQPSIAAGGELNINLPLSIVLPADAPRFTGYRVLAFYP